MGILDALLTATSGRNFSVESKLSSTSENYFTCCIIRLRYRWMGTAMGTLGSLTAPPLKGVDRGTKRSKKGEQ